MNYSAVLALAFLGGLAACDGAIGAGKAPTPAGPAVDGLAGSAGSTGSAGFVPGMPPGACQPARRLRKLSPDQIDATVHALQIDVPSVAQRLRDTLSLSDATFSSYAARLDMSQPHVSEISEAAKRIAEAAIKPGGPAAACSLPSAPAECVNAFLATFGERAFRRPLSSEELAAFAGYYEAERKLDDAPTSLTSLLRVIFMSPSFLFRSELGAADDAGQTVSLTQSEIASSIAYYLTDAPPDAMLAAAAERGELGTPESRASQVRRLLGSETLGSGLLRFFGEYFRTATVGSISARDAGLYPDFNKDVARAYGQETQAFFAEVMLRDGAQLSTLLTAPYVMVSARSAPFYGISGVTGELPVRRMPPSDQRAGILTQASFLTRFAHDKEGNPVSRGRFVRERLLCESVPSPPPTVNAVPPPPDGQRTQRERLASHGSDPGCAGCHQLMDPLGLAFQNYDAVGRYRATELDQPVDASGVTQDSAGGTFRFANARELTSQLAESPAVKACFARQTFFYAQGMSNDDAGNCSFAAHAERVAKAGGSIADLIVELVSSSEFFLRTKEPE